MGAGSTFLDLEDFIVSHLLLPVGRLVYAIFATSRYGWGWDNLRKEANQGRGLKIASWMRFYITYILPIIILVIFLLGLNIF